VCVCVCVCVWLCKSESSFTGELERIRSELSRKWKVCFHVYLYNHSRFFLGVLPAKHWSIAMATRGRGCGVRAPVLRQVRGFPRGRAPVARRPHTWQTCACIPQDLPGKEHLCCCCCCCCHSAVMTLRDARANRHGEPLDESRSVAVNEEFLKNVNQFWPFEKTTTTKQQQQHFSP